MTIVSMIVGQPLPGADPAEIQKVLREACDMARKHGAENVTVLSMATGAPSNTISVMSTAKDWIHYGQVRPMQGIVRPILLPSVPKVHGR